MAKVWAAAFLPLALAVACGEAPMAEPGEPRADVEFSLGVTSPEQRQAIAIALWKTGVASHVASAADGGQPYRVYLKDRGNLVLTSHVHRVLDDQPGVLEVTSLAGYVGVTD